MTYWWQINYPKNRNSHPCSREKAKKISESKKIVDEKFAKMSKEEFDMWLSNKNLYRKDGIPNGNIIRILKLRNLSLEEFYN